jgi:acetyl esterase/lipase
MVDRKIIFTLLLMIPLFVMAQKTEMVEYKVIDTTHLTLKVFSPADVVAGKKYPAIVFFFGGGWVTRAITQFETQAKYFAKRGMVCFIADYRVEKINGTSPFVSLMDAKSAMRHIRKNADRFGVDADKIIASGGSAGGHLAAATALIDDYNDPKDDLSVSPKPAALVLFNPVIDNGPGGYGYERIGEQYKAFSPLHNVVKGMPPTIVFLGDGDDLIPVETMQYFKKITEIVGSRCDLFIYPGQEHGFFNQPLYKNNTMYEADKFLSSLGFLSGNPEINLK